MLHLRPFRTTTLVLLTVYLATMAPGLTLWDAGEFQSAVATLGIPHPPGAPLYVLIGRVWTFLWPDTSLTVAMNALSAVSTALGGGVVAWLFAKWMRSGLAGVATGLASGLLFSVWQNATETEVYALSLLLGLSMLAIAERAGSTGDQRWAALLAFTWGLAASLHLDALLALPASVLLAATAAGERGLQLRPLLRWVAPALLAAALGQGSLSLLGLCVVGGSLYLLLPLPGSREARVRTTAYELGLVALGASSALFMLVRAAHDPGVNQGDPSTWARFVDVVTRVQYDAPGIFPRRAPLWLQFGNMMQYLDWQFAFGLDDSTAFSLLRAPITALVVALAWAGGRAHWRRDARSARAWLWYGISGSVGALLVLNLQAGPSIGWGILPPTAGHEARDRDYFFVVAFVVIAAWAAQGLCQIVRATAPRAGKFVPLAVGALLVLGNAPAANRRHEPEASVSSQLADALLASAPPRTVLLLAGDNDTFAVWHAQHVRRMRGDVVPVTVPLLGAQWYREELRRRHDVLPAAAVRDWLGLERTLLAMRAQVAGAQRPFAAAASLDATLRNKLAPSWSLRGLAYVAGAVPSARTPSVDSSTSMLARPLARSATALRGRDPATRYIQRLLSCPLVVMAHEAGAGGSLDSVCNFR